MRKVLVLSGGGIRGVLTASVLKNLEKHLSRPLHESFDLVAGTSTGSILAACVATGMPADTILQYYKTVGSKVFRRSLLRKITNPFNLIRPKYSSKALIDQISEMFPYTLQSLLVPCMSTAYSTREGKVKIFKSWKEDDQLIYDLYDTVLASSAAPTYFPEYKGFVDGGVYANDPSLVAALEAQKLWPGEPVEIISIGTGYIPKHFKTTRWGAKSWIVKGTDRPIVDVFMNASSDLVQYVCTNFLPDNYTFTRIDVDLSQYMKEAPMDRVDPEYLEKLEQIGSGLRISQLSHEFTWN